MAILPHWACLDPHVPCTWCTRPCGRIGLPRVRSWSSNCMLLLPECRGILIQLFDYFSFVYTIGPTSKETQCINVYPKLISQ